MKWFALLLCCVLSTSSFAVPQAPAAPQAPPMEEVDDYYQLHDKAVQQGKPLIVWVGCYDEAQAKQMGNCLHHKCEKFFDAAPGSIVVGKPSGNELLRYDVSSVRGAMGVLAPRTSSVRVYSNANC